MITQFIYFIFILNAQEKISTCEKFKNIKTGRKRGQFFNKNLLFSGNFREDIFEKVKEKKNNNNNKKKMKKKMKL